MNLSTILVVTMALMFIGASALVNNATEDRCTYSPKLYAVDINVCGEGE